MKPEIAEGNVVFSKKGRDKGHMFVVLLSLDTDFVLIADGRRRTLAHPKKKRRKHLSATPHFLPEIPPLHALGRLKDSDLRKALASLEADEAASAAQAAGSSHARGDVQGNYATVQNKEG